MFFPWHALSIFGLQLGLRTYQMLALAHENALPSALWTQLPWLLWPDVLVSLLTGLIWDEGEARWCEHGQPARRKLLHGIFGSVFACLVVYLGFSFKFYIQFEDFFNYGFWTQVDHLGSFWKPIGQEIGPGAWAGIAGLLAYAWGVRSAARAWPRWGQNHARWPLVLQALATVWVLSFSPWGHVLPNANWHALDKNPFKELASFFLPEPVAGAPRQLEKNAVFGTHLPMVRPLPPAQRQNFSVLLIIMESTTPEYAGLTRVVPAGLTPNLLRLAATSLVFTNHYCQEPATLKSWYALLTGRYSYATRRWKDFIARAQPDLSLPEILKTQGYTSVFLTSSNGRTYSQNEFLRGRFDEVQDLQTLKKRYPAWREFSDCLDDRVLPGALDDYLAQHAGKKFFAVVSPYFPHHPYTIPDPVFQVTPGQSDFQKYQNSLHFADFIIGQLLGVLDRNHRTGDTLVVIVSDHGEAFRQHPGNRLHSVYLYEENVRTLFLLHQPRLLRPGRVAALTRHIDVAPNILDLLGYAGPGCDGQSAVLATPAPAAYFYTTFNDPRLGLRQGVWKYLLNRRSGAEELYNLAADPGETRNLAPVSPERCREARQNLDALEEKIR